MNVKQWLAIVFTLIFVVVFIVANWKGNQFLRLSLPVRLGIAVGIWLVLAGLVIASHVIG